MLREVRLQNEMLRKRDLERDEKLKAASTSHLHNKKAKKRKHSDSSDDDLPIIPKKKPLPINNVKMAEVFDPFQFIPKTNTSTFR